MRVSNYTVVIPLPSADDNCLLLNGLTGALDKVSGKVGEALRRSGRDFMAPAELPVSKGTLERLHQRGHLTDQSAEAERELMVRVASRLHSNGLARALPSFSFIPSYVCQLRCPYCFQPHSIHKGRDEFGAVLSDAQIRSAFAIIDEMSRRGSFARLAKSGELRLMFTPPARAREDAPSIVGSIGLFGGEPLTTHTRPAVERIAAESRKRGLTISAITNGVELHEFEHLLGDGAGNLTELQITFDGDRETHDRRRVGPGHRATFDTIASNVELALAKGVHVHARMNVDSTNLAAVERLTRFFAGNRWTSNAKFDFHVAAVDADPAKNKRLVNRSDVVETTTRLYDEGFTGVVSYEGTAREFVLQAFSSDEYPFSTTANCSAEVGQMMFDPLGDVHSCWDEVGDRSRRIGTYDETGVTLVGEVAATWLSRFPGAIEDCSLCPYALIHKSGCGSQARLSSGSLFAPDCKTFQEHFPRSLAHAYAEVEGIIMSGARTEPAQLEVSA